MQGALRLECASATTAGVKNETIPPDRRSSGVKIPGCMYEATTYANGKRHFRILTGEGRLVGKDVEYILYTLLINLAWAPFVLGRIT